MPGIHYGGLVINSEPDFPSVRNLHFGPSYEPSPAVGRLPLVPIRHKACRPNHFPAPWLGKEGHTRLLFSMQSRDDPAKNQNGPGSNESENDLAAMVHEFIENNGSYGHDGNESSDSDTGSPSIARLSDTLKVLVSSATPSERILQKVVVQSIVKEKSDSICEDSDADCKGGCVRRLIVKNLKSAGYDAAVCKSKWQSTAKVPGGDYEYIDVLLNEQRIIVDLEFRSQFKIARPIPHYLSALKQLPTLFVGDASKLQQILNLMSEAAKCSLKQKSLYLPPWRTLDYMKAKWLSVCERQTLPDSNSPKIGSDLDNLKPPCQQLNRFRASFKSENKRASTFASGRYGAPRVNRISRTTSDREENLLDPLLL